MISLDVTVTGGQIASALQDDAEELFYFLQGLADCSEQAQNRLIDEVASISGPNPEITAFLRSLADGIDPVDGDANA